VGKFEDIEKSSECGIVIKKMVFTVHRTTFSPKELNDISIHY